MILLDPRQKTSAFEKKTKKPLEAKSQSTEHRVRSSAEIFDCIALTSLNSCYDEDERAWKKKKTWFWII